MTREQYLQSVGELVHSNDRPATGLKASTLGNLILRSLPEHWNRHGFLTLKEVLQELERRGQLRMGLDSQKMLAVWSTVPPKATEVRQQAPVGPSPRDSRDRSMSFPRLRREVWVAFVNALPPGLRFMHRRTGVIQMGQAFSPNGDENGWVPITPIPQEQQKQWALELVNQFHLEDVRDAINDPMWHLRFAVALKGSRTDALTHWNRVRSTNVGEIVSAWCEQNRVPRDLVLDTQVRTTRTSEEGTGHADVGADVRQRVLDALSRMPTHELLEIPIPSKYLLTGHESDPI